MIEFKSPKPEQVDMMKEFADVVSQALMLIEKYEINGVLVKVADKIQEAMHWFQSGVLNDAVCVKAPVDVPVPAAEPEAPVEAPQE